MRLTIVSALLAISLAVTSHPLSAVDTAETIKHPLQLMYEVDAAAPKADAIIQYGKLPIQSGELRLPKGKGPFPVAILIHGGCWVSEMGGSGMQGFSEALRQRGVATWDIDYRRLGHEGGGWPGSFEDISAGVDYLTTIAKSHPVDLGKVTIVGHSAGAHFALWAASRSKLDAPWKSGDAAPKFASVVAIDGPGALAPLIGIDGQFCGRPVIVPFMGGTPNERPAEYQIASPASRLPLGMTQLLVVGELGFMMEPYGAAAKGAGDPVQMLKLPDANHFNIVTAGEKNGNAVADWIVEKAFGLGG